MMDSTLVFPLNGTGSPLHPYFPHTVALPSYVANTLSALVLVSIFAAGCVVIFGITHIFIQQTRPSLSAGESLTTMWFVLCGCIHLFFEGYFSYNFLDMAGRTDLFGQLWKEYSLSDSRYLTQDPFVVCMETITAVFWGPLSFLCAYAIVKDLPIRHPLQIIISLGQLYGDILYYATCWFNEIVYQVVYCRPESFYFWAYYFLCNFFWIVIPFGLILSSIAQISSAFSELKSLKAAKKSN